MLGRFVASCKFIGTIVLIRLNLPYGFIIEINEASKSTSSLTSLRSSREVPALSTSLIISLKSAPVVAIYVFALNFGDIRSHSCCKFLDIWAYSVGTLSTFLFSPFNSSYVNLVIPSNILATSSCFLFSRRRSS